MPPKSKKIKAPSGNVVSVRKGYKLIVHVVDEADSPLNNVSVGARRTGDEAVKFSETTARLKKHPNKISSGSIDGVAYFGGAITPGDYDVYLDGYRPNEENSKRVTVEDPTEHNRRNPHAILKLRQRKSLSEHLRTAAERAKLELKWLEIQMDTTQGVLGVAALADTLVEDLLRNRTRKKLDELLTSVHYQFKGRLGQQREVWLQEQQKLEADKKNIAYPKWEKPDEKEPDDEEKESCKGPAIALAATMRSLTLWQFTEFITDRKIFSNSCGQTANHIEEMLNDPGHPWGQASDKEMDALCELLTETAREYPRDCWYCRIEMGPHAFIVEFLGGETRIYQSWFGFYTLADRIPEEKRRTLDEFLLLLKGARKNNSKAQGELFGVPPQDMKRILKYKLNVQPAGTDQIQRNINDKIDKDKDWATRLPTDKSVRDHCKEKFGF
jgi:hypothetical protein